jgi:hypothetical protein
MLYVKFAYSILNTCFTTCKLESSMQLISHYMIYSQQLMVTGLINSKYYNSSLKHSFYGNTIFNYAFFSHTLFQDAIRAYIKALVCVFIMKQFCLLQIIFFHDIVININTCAFKMSVFLNMTPRGLV